MKIRILQIFLGVFPRTANDSKPGKYYKKFFAVPQISVINSFSQFEHFV